MIFLVFHSYPSGLVVLTKLDTHDAADYPKLPWYMRFVGIYVDVLFRLSPACCNAV